MRGSRLPRFARTAGTVSRNKPQSGVTNRYRHQISGPRAGTTDTSMPAPTCGTPDTQLAEHFGHRHHAGNQNRMLGIDPANQR